MLGLMPEALKSHQSDEMEPYRICSSDLHALSGEEDDMLPFGSTLFLQKSLTIRLERENLP